MGSGFSAARSIDSDWCSLVGVACDCDCRMGFVWRILLMVLNNEGELNFLWCVIGIAIGALIGFACTFTKMNEDAKEQERSRRSLW